MPQYNSTDKRTQTIGIENYTESDIVLEVIGDTTFTGDVSLGDDHVINLGDANDLKIYHDSTFNNGVIQESGSGNLLLAGQNIDFRDANLGDSYAIFRDDSVNTSVELYYNNTKKFETTTTGVTVIGTVVADGVDLGDDERIRLGDAQDLQIYHNGTTAQSIIEESGGGSLLIQGTNLLLRSTAGENYFQGTANGSVELFYDAAKKFETTATGATTTGIHVADGFDAGDNERIRLGDAQDLQIYHDTANSIIDTATGNLILSSANAIDIYNSSISEVRARFLNNGGVELYYDNSKKFETTTSGVTITGDVTVTGTEIADANSLQKSFTATTTSTSATLIASINGSTYRSVEFLIQVSENGNFHMEKVLVVHDGTTAYMTAYGTVHSGSVLATFDTDIVSNVIRLLATASSTNTTTYKVVATAIKY